MKHYLKIQNHQQHIERPARVRYCDSFMCRLRGFTFRKRIEPDEGLLLVQSRDSRLDTAIHMLFVPFQLAVIWIDSSLTVVDRVLAQPWRLAYLPGRPARYILEIHPGRLEDYRIEDKLEFKHE
jgi:uncharacterized membrane protein (UPF0127 family)